MNTTPKSAEVILTVYAWGENVSSAMEIAQKWETNGWKIQGNPAPMVWCGRIGTGVPLSRGIELDEQE